METNKLYLNTKSFVLAFEEYLTGLIALDSEYINIKTRVINDETIKKYKSKHDNLANEFFTKTIVLTKSGGLDIQMENFKVNSDESKIKNYSKVMTNDFKRLSSELSVHQQKIAKSYSFLLDTSIDTTTYFSGLNILFNHLFGVELSNTNNQTYKPTVTPEPKGIYDFFDEVIKGEISDTEIYNNVEKTTNNFDEVKTKLILKDLDFYLFASKIELENDYNLNDLVEKDKKYKSFDEIPFSYGKDFITGEVDKSKKHYDYEKLFYPHLFFNLYRLRKLIISKLVKPAPPEPKTPFNDPKTHELFNYIVDNWNYDKDVRYAYIFNYMVDTLDYRIIPTDYEKYIRTKYNIGRVYFENANSSKRTKQIEDIVNNYNQI